MPLISIITICYNESNLKTTCESIVNQTFQDFEWIVIDGASNEDTQKIWEKYKYRINKFISEPDSGIYNAYNKGIKLACGKWINFMNAGDSYSSNDIIEKIFDKKDYFSDVLYGNTIATLHNSTRDRKMFYPNRISKSFFVFDNLNTQSTFIRTELFEKYGLYNEHRKILSDYEQWLIFWDNNVTFEYIPFFVAKFDFSGISSNKKNIKILIEEKNDILQKHFTKEDIIKSKKEYARCYKTHYNILEQFFSIKNAENNTHKIITILGIHIKIRRNDR